MISPVGTQQFILLFSYTCFDQKGYHWVEWNIKRIYIHNFIWNWDLASWI